MINLIEIGKPLLNRDKKSNTAKPPVQPPQENRGDLKMKIIRNNLNVQQPYPQPSSGNNQNRFMPPNPQMSQFSTRASNLPGTYPRGPSPGLSSNGPHSGPGGPGQGGPGPSNTSNQSNNLSNVNNHSHLNQNSNQNSNISRNQTVGPPGPSNQTSKSSISPGQRADRKPDSKPLQSRQYPRASGGFNNSGGPRSNLPAHPGHGHEPDMSQEEDDDLAGIFGVVESFYKVTLLER